MAEPAKGVWGTLLDNIKLIAGSIAAVAAAITAVVGLTGNDKETAQPPSTPSISSPTFSPTPPVIPSLPGTECASAFSREPVLSLSRTSGPQGTRLTISGSGFTADEKVRVRFHTERLRDIRTDAGGSFSSVSIQIPPDWQFDGRFDIVATGDRCQQSVSESFLVT